MSISWSGQIIKDARRGEKKKQQKKNRKKEPKQGDKPSKVCEREGWRHAERDG